MADILLHGCQNWPPRIPKTDHVIFLEERNQHSERVCEKLSTSAKQFPEGLVETTLYASGVTFRGKLFFGKKQVLRNFDNERRQSASFVELFFWDFKNCRLYFQRNNLSECFFRVFLNMYRTLGEMSFAFLARIFAEGCHNCNLRVQMNI